MKEYVEPINLKILRNEIKISELIIEDEIKPSIERTINKYIGEYRPEVPMDIYLNEIYPIIQYELPSIFFKVPRVILKPRNKGYFIKKKNIFTGEKEDIFVDGQKSANTQESILNYSIEQMKYKVQMRKVLLDALLFKYGAMWHGYKGNFGMTDESSIYIQDEKIFVKRISPCDILFDPKVTLSNIDEAEWVGRKFDIPLRNLREDDRLKLSKDLKGKNGFGAILNKDNPMLNTNGNDKLATYSKSKTLLDYTDPEFRNLAQYVTCYEIFVRPTPAEKRKGEKGKVYLLCDAQIEPLRENDWPYKTTGWPLKILMFNEVPDKMFGMADIDVFDEIAHHKNIIHNLQLRNAESNSKVITLFDKSGLSEEQIAKIESGEQSIIGVDGEVTGKITMASPGGQASSELYLVDGRIQQNLDEKSGVNDLKKGALRSGEESATSVRIRNAGSSARPAFRQDIMSDFLIDSFKFLNDLNQQFMPIDEAVRIMGTLDIVWSENPSKEEIQADVDVEIDVISMLPESPEKELEQNKMVLDIMTEALNNPAFMTKVTQEGKMFNISPIIEQMLMRLKIRNPEVFRSIRPEETLGFAPVGELRYAQANVEAINTGQPLPSPPDVGQAHQVRVGYYQSIQRLEAIQGKVNESLEKLISLQMQIAEEESSKKSPRQGQSVKLSKPSMNTV